MEDLPSDLHRYFASFLDLSTRILFPLTCKSLYESLGIECITAQKSLVMAAQDDNLELMLLFLKKCDKTSRGFYQHNVLIPALKGNAPRVLKWFTGKKYKAVKPYICQAIQTISLTTLDFYLQHLQETYSREILSYVYMGDRVDILQNRYLNGNNVDFELTSLDIQNACKHDAVKCFTQYIRLLHLNLRIPYFQTALYNAGEKIVSSIVEGIFAAKNQIQQNTIDKILVNQRCESEVFFERLSSIHSFSLNQYILIIDNKSIEVVQLVMKNVEIEEEHCKAVIRNISKCYYSYANSRHFKIAKYLFERFSGKLRVDRERQCCYDVPCTLQNLIAEKLVDIQCLENCMFNESNTELFNRFVSEGRFEEKHYQRLYGDKNGKMLKIYLRQHSIPDQYHLSMYANMGEIFYKTMIAMGQSVSHETIKKRLVYIRRQERREEKEQESKRFRKN